MTSVQPQQQPPAVLVTTAWTLTAIAAIAAPSLLALNLPPSSTYLNQAVAMIGWGLCLMTLAAWFIAGSAGPILTGDRTALQRALAVPLLAAMLSPYWAGTPWSLALSSAGLIATAALAAQLGTESRRGASSEPIFRAICLGMLVAGVISGAIGIVQCFAPQWTDGNLIAHAATPGRAGGNLRQPNHLSSLLLWSMAALVWLHDALIEKKQSAPVLVKLRVVTAALMAALVFGVVLTVSRTGMVCVALLALWGVVDKRLSPFARAMLWLAPLVYVLGWMGVSEWAQVGSHAFAGESQLHGSDLSSSRFGIWANTLSLIAQHPWFGVGWGEFNFAWTLTPFPGRPGAFFDHTHNLPLQFLVELGIPLGTLVLALLMWALWKAFVACIEAPESQSLTVRTAFVMVLMMVVHSMLEYPLWYAYFLLPTAFAFGICLGSSGAATAVKTAANKSKPKPSAVWFPRALLVASVLMAVGSVASVVDYMRVVAIFSPPDDALPLSDRIADGQRSWFFSHHADYAAATTAAHPSTEMAAFKRASHYLLDTRLMLAWARAFNESGDVERARYIAQRLREFHNPQSDSFFAECDAPRAADKPLPFQCTPPTKAFTYEDFR